MSITEIAGYRVIRQLGAGGMGQVFLVEHPRLPRQDALKLLDSGVSRNDDFKARFQREADLLAQLSHPNIVTLHDRGEFEDRLWITMEYVAGTDAAELLKADGPLDPDLAVQLVSGAGAALDYAWRKQRITHRDVKPANILVGIDDTDGAPQIESVKLADFGIAKAAGEATSLTSTGITVGTMQYISPEAIEGEDLDNRADIYSLGCTAFHLLTGQPPFSGRSITALMNAHLNQVPPSVGTVAPKLSVALDAVFAKVLAKKPDDRYQSCAEFVAALQEAAGAEVDPAYVRTMTAATLPARAAGLEPNAVTELRSVKESGGGPAQGKSRMVPILAAVVAVFAVAATVLGVYVSRAGDEASAAVTNSTTTAPPTVTTSISTSSSAPVLTTTSVPVTTTVAAATTVAPAATPTVLKCLEGTPGPALWSDGTMRYSEYCYQKNGGPAYSRAEEAANAPQPGHNCYEVGTTRRGASGQTLTCIRSTDGESAGQLIWVVKVRN
ncbi:serine/threonine-protein kinase [Tsukamurella pseudospumae]|uniref:serine/threonine-protein kinase n=1 Tax=Tsukamurella pseudospumae TaxID=239498 RepID=UPI000A7F0891|nr:serine/threonine-protein kinase [Tsukamurella pseudospumae]